MPKRKSPLPAEASFELSGQSFQADIAALKAFLLAHTQSGVSISAKLLRRADSRLFQYLIAATQSWRARGLTLTMVELPPAMESDLENLGILPDMIIRKAIP